MSVLSQHSFGQSCLSISNCTTVSATLASFTGNTITITAANRDTSLNGLSGKLIYIPPNITFTGKINNIDASSVICVDAKAGFTPSELLNFSGTIRNYSSSITLNNSFGGNIENYGGTFNINSVSQLYSGKYILNCSGKINWNSALNLSGGSIYNAGQMYIAGEVSSTGCIQNEAWMTIGSYNGQCNITNNGKIEILGEAIYFNGGGSLVNNCALFSANVGAKFHNNINITNNGLIYLPSGEFKNYGSFIFKNETTGVVRAENFYNESTIEGSGWFYITDRSEIRNQGKFGIDNKGLHFYDATYSGSTSKFDEGQTLLNVGSNVSFAQFPMPEYTPDLSLYQCGSIVLAGSVHPGTIAASQILCLGVSPQGFTSLQDAWVDDGGATITYQWQSSTDGTNFTNISGETDNEYSITTRPSAKTYYRRRAKATYSGADSIKNSMYGSNIVSLTPVSTPPPSVTTSPTSTSVCENSQAQFTASGQYYKSLQWQESQDKGVNWADLSNTVPYSGTTTDTLTINPASTSMNGRLYRLAVISNNCGTAFSDSATLTVITNDAPVISAQPADQIVCIGSTSAQFSVASSSTVKSYRWQVSTNNGGSWSDCTGGNYSGATTNNLTVNSGGLTNGHQFRCELTATCNATTSDPATLYVVTPEVKVTPVDISPKCPDTDPALEFNPLDNQYDMGNSRVTFTILRQTAGLFAWSFSYSVTANPSLLATNQPQSTTETINVAAGTSSYDLSFYLENQTTSSVDVTMSLSNVSVAGCTETSSENPDHSAIIQVRKLPVSGQFITN